MKSALGFISALKLTFTTCLLLTFTSLNLTAETVHLKNGQHLKAEILKKSDQYLILNIGSKVITLPMKEIESISKDSPVTKSSKLEVDLYNTISSRQEKSVKANLNRCAEAVVQVRTSVGLGSGFISTLSPSLNF